MHMDTNFDYNSFPASFVHCLNESCKRGEQCLRRQMALRIPNERTCMRTINPGYIESLPDGNCKFFLLDQPQRYARGFTHLFDNIPHQKALAIKAQMLQYFGRTVYYRCYRKERLIKPFEQERIRQMYRSQQISEEPQFDEYVPYYDLDYHLTDR